VKPSIDCAKWFKQQGRGNAFNMRVVVVGATGNVGTSVLQALGREPGVESVLGVARRLPELDFAKTDWAGADISRDDLVPLFKGADVVIHLAWLIQPSRDLATLYATNVRGSKRLIEAVAEAEVPAVVYASSVGAYSPGPKKERVDESWPTNGIPTSFYSRHKAEVERMLDRFESESPHVRVVRMRPGLIFKRDAAAEIRRLFAGPLLPGFLLRPGLIPIVPRMERLRFQAVHSRDVGDAYRLAVVQPVRGAFNLAAEPVLDSAELARLLRAKPLRIPAAAVRAAMGASWRLRLQPSPPGWLDMALGVPIMDVKRAREELGWSPRFRSDEAFMDLLQGLREGAGLGTPPLESRAGGPWRSKEFATGVGAR
jgi:UDP-glucose 4-epimerase